MERKIVHKIDVINGLKDLEIEVAKRLDEKGNGAFVSNHEILGCITEEYWELIEAVHNPKLYLKITNDASIKNELLDIAVAAIFGYVCLKADIFNEQNNIQKD